METKFTEITQTTSSLQEMKNKYIAKRVFRKWSEDFVDEDSGEVVQIERRELLFEKGIFIDSDVLSEINFYLQSQDIESIEVSNHKREGFAVSQEIGVYAVNVTNGKKKKTFYLYADSIETAIAISNDFLEQKIKGSFNYNSVKVLGDFYLLPAEEEQDKNFYKVEIEITFEDGESYKNTYILQATDADDAKETINKRIALEQKKNNTSTTFETAILSASTIPCNCIISAEFSKDYLENL